MATAGTRLLQISIGATDFTAQVGKCTISGGAAEDDFMTFSEAAAGGSRDYTLNITALVDHATGTLWDKVWTAAGTDVPCTYKPYGNVTPSVTQPHYTFTATVTEPDGDIMGAEANKSPVKRQTFEAAWPIVSGKPTKVTTV